MNIFWALFEIDLSFFPEPEPRFAYVDDLRCRVEVLKGLAITSPMTIEGQPDFMWLSGTREGVLLTATAACRESVYTLLTLAATNTPDAVDKPHIPTLAFQFDLSPIKAGKTPPRASFYPLAQAPLLEMYWTSNRPPCSQVMSMVSSPTGSLQSWSLSSS